MHIATCVVVGGAVLLVIFLRSSWCVVHFSWNSWLVGWLFLPACLLLRVPSNSIAELLARSAHQRSQRLVYEICSERLPFRPSIRTKQVSDECGERRWISSAQVRTMAEIWSSDYYPDYYTGTTGASHLLCPTARIRNRCMSIVNQIVATKLKHRGPAQLHVDIPLESYCMAALFSPRITFTVILSGSENERET